MFTHHMDDTKMHTKKESNCDLAQQLHPSRRLHVTPGQLLQSHRMRSSRRPHVTPGRLLQSQRMRSSKRPHVTPDQQLQSHRKRGSRFGAAMALSKKASRDTRSTASFTTTLSSLFLHTSPLVTRLNFEEGVFKAALVVVFDLAVSGRRV